MSLSKKLLIKPNNKVILLQAPDGFTSLLDPLPEGVSLSETGTGEYDAVLLFVLNSTELNSFLPTAMSHLRPESVFWICYPKKSSGIASDLEMMQSWDELAKYDYQGVAAAAINEQWTALRFRPSSQVKKTDNCNDAIETGHYAEFIDIKNRTVSPPLDLQTAFSAQPSAIGFFEALSYSNKKEYVMWIMTAKQEKTRIDRVAKTVEKLLAGKKNPAEK